MGLFRSMVWNRVQFWLEKEYVSLYGLKQVMHFVQCSSQSGYVSFYGLK